MNDKIAWSGVVASVQPRIRLVRSFDERSPTYLGYLLRIKGTLGGVSADFRVGIGSGTHAKHQLRIGDHLEGLGHRVADPRLEIADIYKVSKLKLIARGEEQATAAPWHGAPPPLPVYRERGHRRLAVTTYDSKMQQLYLGLRHVCGNDPRPMESRPEALQNGNHLLRTSVLLPLQAGSHPQGSRSPRHDL